jgi:peroxin-2
MRSSQLDAARLDEELSGMLREQFLRAFAFFRPAAVAQLQPELSLLLDFLVGSRHGLRPHLCCPC